MIAKPPPRLRPDPKAISPPPAPPEPSLPPLPPGHLHYDAGGGSRWRVLAIPVLLAAGLHVLGLFGFNTKRPPPPKPAAEAIQFEFLPPPPLEDLDEPEPVPGEGEPGDLPEGSYVPTLADVPSVNVASDFVQRMDIASLQPRPDLAAAKVVTIPRSTRQAPAIGAGLKNVFNLADLDRVPEPMFRPPPVFPHNLKREVVSADVMVEFIVSIDGRVLQARAISSTYPGFEDAAIAGVSRWLFRPGIKNGKKVNTRMRVPLLFRVVDE